MSTVNTSFCEELFYSDCLLYVSNNNTVFLLVCFLLSKSKQNQAPKYKQNVDELIRPHPGCLVLPLVTDKPDVHV